MGCIAAGFPAKAGVGPSLVSLGPGLRRGTLSPSIAAGAAHAEGAGECVELAMVMFRSPRSMPSDIGPVIAADIGQRLLRQALRLAQPPHIAGDDPLQPPAFLAPFAIRYGTEMHTISLHLIGAAKAVTVP